MATISKRGKGSYAQVRRKGYPARFGTFRTKLEAAEWARAEEKLLRASEETRANESRVTPGELFTRTCDTASVQKREAASEKARISKII
jgi:hypothetical protein